MIKCIMPSLTKTAYPLSLCENKTNTKKIEVIETTNYVFDMFIVLHVYTYTETSERNQNTDVIGKLATSSSSDMILISKSDLFSLPGTSIRAATPFVQSSAGVHQ